MVRGLDRYAYAGTAVVPSENQEWRPAPAPIRDNNVTVLYHLKNSPWTQSASSDLVPILIVEQEGGNIRH
jgi:hypothetical protein